MNQDLSDGGNNVSSKVRWGMLSFALIATILNYVDRLAFNYLSAEGALRELIPDDTFGYIGTAFFVGYMVSNLVSGFVIDRLGVRLGYSLCMAFWTTATILQSLAMLPFHFGIFRALLGIGEAGNWPAAIKLTSEWFPSSERSTATGIFNSGAAIGSVIAPPLIVWLGSTYGWRATFIIIGAVGYLWVAAFWFTYYTPERSLKEARARIIPPLKLFKTRFVSWFTLSKVCMDPIWYFITFWIGRYLVDVHGWELKEIGWLVIIPFIVADFGNVLGGFFTQYIIKRGTPISRARKISVAIFGGLMGISLMLGPFIISTPASALVVLSLASFGYAAYTSNTMAFPGDVVPQSAIASVWGIASVGAGFGGMLFQSLSGLTVKNLSDTYNYSVAYNTVFVGYGILAFIGLAIVLFLIGPLIRDPKLQSYVDADENITVAN